MGIQPLPQNTVRALGASQVLNDPASVVKELIDNALDARATSIAIEISSNTVDAIQVRDNGHGIPPEDRPLVARPHCTSKIDSEDDLKKIGGTSLGFRGEALSSVAETSGSLTISTRVEGEDVATALLISQRGEVTGQERASLPMGTTIKITDFVKRHPVRRQLAIKNADKCFKKIKQTLQSYAFARPHVRLSFKVLKAKNDKGNWIYAPKLGGNAEDAAFKIVGAACASESTWSVVEERGLTLQAFLPKQDADVVKISNVGSFISVDARPVSSMGGTPNQLVKMFREALKKSNKTFDGVKDPFIYLEINCKAGSYDANVEPAKDDVLFEDPDTVLAAARRLFEAVYPAQQTDLPQNEISEPNNVRDFSEQAAPVEDDFFTSLERPSNPSRRAQMLSNASIFPEDFEARLAPRGDDEQQDYDDSANTNQHVFRCNMYGCDEEDLDLLDTFPRNNQIGVDFEELRQARSDVTVSNPWVMAKMNASLRRPLVEHGDPETQQTGGTCQASSNSYVPMLPTPRHSSPSPSQNIHLSEPPSGTQLRRDGRSIGSQSLPLPQLVASSPLRSHMNADSDVSTSDQGARDRPPAYDYALSSQENAAPAGTPLHAIPQSRTRPQRSPKKQSQQTKLNRPFVSPVVDRPLREKVWFDHLEDGCPGPSSGSKKRKAQRSGNDGLVSQGDVRDVTEEPCPLSPPRRNRDMRDFVTTIDLTGHDSAASLIESRNFTNVNRALAGPPSNLQQNIEDYEHTTPESVLNTSEFRSAREVAAMEDPSKSPSRPAKRRKTSEGRALRQISGNATIPGGDGDEYNPNAGDRRASIRRRTTDVKKVRRSKSALLPLERVPKGQEVQRVVLNVTNAFRSVLRSAREIDTEHSLPRWGEVPVLPSAYATLSTAANVRDLTTKLHELLRLHVSDGEMVQDLGMVVQGAFAAHARNISRLEGGVDV